MSNSSRIPVPIAVISAWISLFESTLSMRFFSTLMIFPRSGRIAWVLRSRPCFAEPPAESPSTMKISARAGSRTEQSASLPGSVTRASGVDCLADRLARLGGVLLEELGESLVDRGLDEALDRRVAELRL